MVVGRKLNPADLGGELVEQPSESAFGKRKRCGRTSRCKQKISVNHQLVLAVLHDRYSSPPEFTILSLPTVNIDILQKHCGRKRSSSGWIHQVQQRQGSKLAPAFLTVG